MLNYKVRRYAGSEVSVESAKEMCLDALKELLWREVWRDEINLEGVRWTVRECEDGIVEITAEI